ncbi:MAG: GerMN domain-containing protein [Clostridia bacterium]
MNKDKISKIKNIVIGNVKKYKYMYLSVMCLSVLSVLIYMSSNNQEMFATNVQNPKEIGVYAEDNSNKIEVTFSCIDLSTNKVVDVKEKVDLKKYLENPEFTLVNEYLNYIGIDKIVSPLCNKIVLGDVRIEERTLKIDISNVGEYKYMEATRKKIEAFSNDSKKLACMQTLKQLKNVDQIKFTLDGKEIKDLSYIKGVS